MPEHTETTDEHGCGPDQRWSEDAGECVPKATPAPDSSAKSLADLPFGARLQGIMDDYFKKLSAQSEAYIDRLMAKHVKQKEEQIEYALRKQFGLEKDPIVHMSELTKVLRKMQLEAAEGGKKTPASPDTDVGPAGTLLKAKRPDLDAVYARYGAQKEAT